MPVILPAFIGAGLSVGIGGLVRSLSGDKNPWEPHEVLTDAVVGAIGGGTYGVASKLIGPGASAVSNILREGTRWAISTGVADVAEDFIRHEIYKSPLAPEDVRKQEMNVKPEINIEELTVSVPLAFGTGAVLKGVGELVRAGKIPVPKLGKVSSGEETWAGLYVEKGEQAKPIIGLVKQGSKIRPVRNFQFSKVSPGYEMKSPIETYLAKQAVERIKPTKLDYLPGRAFKRVYEIEKAVAKSPKNLKYIATKEMEDFKNVLKQAPRFKDISDDVYDFLIAQTKKGKIKQVFGSVAQKIQMGKEMSRELHDIDVVSSKPEQIAKEFVKRLKPKLGNTIRVNPSDPSIVERKIGNVWKKLIEFKPSASSYSLFGNEKYVYHGFRPEYPAKTKEGLRIMRLPEQLIRKGGSITQIKEYGLSPERHRLKDIYDFIEIAKYYAKRSENLGYKDIANFLKKQISLLESNISPELRRKILNQIGKKIVENTEKFVIYSPKYGYTYVSPYSLFASIIPSLKYLRKEKSSEPPSKQEPKSKYDYESKSPQSSTSIYESPSTYSPPSEISPPYPSTSKPPSGYSTYSPSSTSAPPSTSSPPGSSTTQILPPEAPTLIPTLNLDVENNIFGESSYNTVWIPEI